MIALLLGLVFGYSQAECNVCAWPYSTGVNSSGKCYPTYSGFQENLAAGCAAWCNTWQANADTTQSVYSVRTYSDPTSGSAPFCECIRLNKGGYVTTKTRPQGVCDWGYSDKLQNYYDSVSVNQRSTTVDQFRQSVTVSSSNVVSFQQSLKTAADAGYMVSYGCTNQRTFFGDGDPNLQGIALMNADYSAQFVLLPPGKNCADFNNQELSTSAVRSNAILDIVRSQDTAIQRLDEGQKAISQSVNASQSSILFAIANSDSALMARMNKGTGGGSADLGPVMAAIEAAKEAQLAAIDTLADTTSFYSHLQVYKLNSILEKQDTTNQQLGGIGHSLSSIDSFNRQARYNDSASSYDQYMKIVDSMNKAPAGKDEADSKLSELTGVSVAGEQNASVFLDGLTGFKNLPGTCSTAPTFDIDLSSVHLSTFSIDMNKYAWVFSLSRGVFRFLGAFAGIKIIMGALSMLGLSNAKRSQ